ncbi:MAG TPA: hypothetical protein VJJ47_03505, partial [Candidatus Paceibacterota bacterium]
MFSLTRTELRLTLVFAAVIWFISIFEANYSLALVLTWAVILYWKRWHKAHPSEGVFEEPEPKKKEEPVSEVTSNK